MPRTILAAVVLILLPAFAQKNVKAPQQREVKVQKTSLSRDQEIQLGKEAAADVERTADVVKSAAVEDWLNQIGQRLAKTPQANAYPYYFKLVNDDSINAFALPGGPMFVNAGLIKAAENESQVAGVLAHEMSHVALRHGANQMSKAQTWQTVLGVIGAGAGMLGSGGGQCGLLCQAVQGGGGLAVNSYLMKFSRDHERDADLNGARMMAAANYNPIDLARFFERLEAQSGSASKPKGLELWLSSHPAPANRVEYVSEDITFYPKASYDLGTGNFESVKRAVGSLPPPKLKPAGLLQAAQNKPRPGLPSGYSDLQTKGFSIAYPAGWQVGQAQQGGGLYMVPKGGAVQTQKGGVELIAGGMADYYQPQSGKAELAASTRDLLNTVMKGDTTARIESTQAIQVGGKAGRVTRLLTKTSYQQERDQVVDLYTVVRGDYLWSLVLAAPPSQKQQLESVFKQMIESVQFPD